MKRQIEIKVCPFCGIKPKVKTQKTDTFSISVSSFEVDISCRSAKCKVHPSLTGYNRFAFTKEEKLQVKKSIIDKWNTRYK